MSRPKVRRLFLVTSDYHFYYEGRVHTTSAFMRFVPELLMFAEHIEISAPVHAAPESDATGFTIESPSINYRPLPPSRTLEQFLRRFPRQCSAILRGLYGGIRSADLVWANGPHPLLPIAAWLSMFLHKPYILWLRGDILAVVKTKYTGAHGRDRLAHRTALYLDRLIRLSAGRGAVFYTGSGLERYAARARYSRPANTSLVQASQLATGARSHVHTPLRLLWAGQLRPLKGLLYLLRSLRLLLDKGQPVLLRLVGSGEQRAELEAERATLNLERMVVFEGYVPPGPALDRYFEEADVFVLPSLSEGVPKVLLEAMARALPVVATKVGGVPDVVQDGENGLLVAPASPDALASAILRAATDEALRTRLSEGALAFAREHTAVAEGERIYRGLREAFPEVWGKG